MQPLLAISDLHTSFAGPDRKVSPAVNGISLSIQSGETLALVGESGSGKSMTALSIMRLLPPSGTTTSGSIIFEGTDLTRLTDADMRRIRGSRISMVFQEPMTSLNPVLRIGDQLTEPLLLHRGMSKDEAVQQGITILNKVGIPSPEGRMRDYPHQLSGGMRQRVMIAMALACNPSLMIADEPTTALDVTIQAQILDLISSLRESTGMGILLITHDLGIVAGHSQHTCVMYAGQIVEEAPTRDLLTHPCHPYTRALLASLPQNTEPGTPLPAISGQAPDQKAGLPGCGFCDRCPTARPECRREPPPVTTVSPNHTVRCWL